MNEIQLREIKKNNKKGDRRLTFLDTALGNNIL